MTPLNSEDAEMKTVVFVGHPPIRVRKSEIHEMWLGYVHLDFGARHLYGVQSGGGVVLWTHTSPAYDTDKESTTFLGRFSPSDTAALKFELFEECGGAAVVWVAEEFGIPNLIETID